MIELFSVNVDMIPIRHDLYSSIMFAGIVQGFFLAAILLLKGFSKSQLLLLCGILMLTLSSILTDLYLCYTGLMKYVLWLNDGSEWISLLLPPLLYFICLNVLKKSPLRWSNLWPHLVLPFIFFLNMWFYWLQPIEHKFNAYVDAYFPSIEMMAYDQNFSGDPLGIKDKIDLLLIIQLISYAIATIFFIRKSMSWSQLIEKASGKNKYLFVLQLLTAFVTVVLTLFVVETSFERDAGDHYVAVFIVVLIFAFGLLIIANSRFLDAQYVASKYDTSGLKIDQAKDLFSRLNSFIHSEDYVNDPIANVQSLAKRLNVPSNYLAQAVFSQTNLSTTDFISKRRIEISKDRLLDQDYQHMTIEAIGNSVGFASKSSFYTNFKKHAGLTPNAYVKSIKDGK